MAIEHDEPGNLFEERPMDEWEMGLESKRTRVITKPEVFDVLRDPTKDNTEDPKGLLPGAIEEQRAAISSLMIGNGQVERAPTLDELDRMEDEED